MFENNSWFRKTSSDTVLVFLHGFFSSSTACWTNKEANISWPELIEADTRFGNISIYMGGYFTDANSETYGVRDCASQFYQALCRTDGDGNLPPISYSKIIFVCHSLGGIVARYMLEKNREDFLQKKIGLVLMASPSWGSDYAEKYSIIASLYKNKVANELRPGSELLSDLDGRFRDFIDLKKDDFLGREAIEHHGIVEIKWLPRLKLIYKIPGFAPIVLRESADRYFSKSRTIPKSNHSNIVKPSNQLHESHSFLVDFIYDFNQRFETLEVKKEIANSILNDNLLTRGALFDIYSEESEPYYLIRSIDYSLSSNFDVASFWLHGPSGCGKTSIIKRLLSKRGVRVVEACFSLCNGESARSQFITELFETLYVKRHSIVNIPKANFQGLIQILLENITEQDSNFVVYIDEVPSGSGANGIENELTALIEDIFTHIKSKTNGNLFRIIVSSLAPPSFELVKHPQKFGGYFYLVGCKSWSELEIKDLAHLITPALPIELEELPLSILRGPNISPRHLKNYMKLKLSQPDWPDAKIIQITGNGS